MRVAVILSTYNGEKYLRQQLDSILGQEGVDPELFIRDDGSRDATVSVLREYEESCKNVHVNAGENIGFRQSFIREMLAHEGFDFYAFSDQDDFWEKDKLKAACDVITQKCRTDVPAVYYSNLNISDEELNICRRTQLEKRKHTLPSVIMRRSIAGCTMVLNRTMWERIKEKEITDQALRRGHDSFIISLCYALGGCVLCDERAFIRYRQHRDNTSGGINGPAERIRKEWNALTRKKGQEAEMANAILEGWNAQIDDRNAAILRTVASSKKMRSRFKLFFSKEYCTGDLKLTALGLL